mgnify:CR=1 FL=1
MLSLLRNSKIIFVYKSVRPEFVEGFLRTVLFVFLCTIPLFTQNNLVAETTEEFSEVEETTEKTSGKTPFESYWEKYYPSAGILCRTFLAMSPEEIDGAISKIADTFSNKPWLYFQDSVKDFDSRYLEGIWSEIRTILIFIEYSKVNVQDNHVYYFEYDQEPKKDQHLFIPLADYWEEKGCVAYYDLCALAFDLIVIRFNSIVLSFFKDRDDWYDAESDLYLMEWLGEKLAGSKYVSGYQEHLKRFKKVCKLLEKSIKDKEGDQRRDEYQD